MEIHSSSLAYTPTGYNSKNRNEPSPSSDSRKANNSEPSPLSSDSNIRKVDKKIDVPTLELISSNLEQQRQAPSNSRTAQAINAYTQENAQVLINQRSELVPRIDLFA